ncbi:hypothetical protein CRV24_002554 [Beauveria bassiana]|nr:hypothetical protein CRV24_002554 [Beauveria bassiana]
MKASKHSRQQSDSVTSSRRREALARNTLAQAQVYQQRLSNTAAAAASAYYSMPSTEADVYDAYHASAVMPQQPQYQQYQQQQQQTVDQQGLRRSASTGGWSMQEEQPQQSQFHQHHHNFQQQQQQQQQPQPQQQQQKHKLYKQAEAKSLLEARHRPSSGAWSIRDDQQLITARSDGLNWSQIQERFFPSKSSNACRKRHERLIDSKGRGSDEAARMERIATHYVLMREKLWRPLADLTDEKWSFVEKTHGMPSPTGEIERLGCLLDAIGRHASHLLELFLFPEALFACRVAKEAAPRPAPHVLLLQHRQHEHGGQMPDARPKEASGAALVAVVLPETHRLAREPEIHGQASHRKGPFGDARGAQGNANRDKDEAVSQGHARVARRVGPGEHAQACGLVLVANGPAQSHEVRELPGKEQARQQPAADGRAVTGKKQLLPGAILGGGFTSCRRPAHQRRDAADKGADPGIESRNALEWCVYPSIEHDIGNTQKGDGRVYAKVQAARADCTSQYGKEGGAPFRNEPSHKRPVSCSRHLGVGVGLVEHVEKKSAPAGK